MERWKELFRFSPKGIQMRPNKSSGLEIVQGAEIPPQHVRERLLSARERLSFMSPENQPPADNDFDDLSPSPVRNFPPDSSGSAEQLIDVEKV